MGVLGVGSMIVAAMTVGILVGVLMVFINE